MNRNSASQNIATGRRSSHRKIVEHLRRTIAVGTYKVGDRLPSFQQLHRQFGVAPSTVSKALGVLEGDGLVERRNGSGVYVTGAAPSKRRIRIAVHRADLTTHIRSDYWSNFTTGVQQAAYSLGAEAAFLPLDDDIHLDGCSGLLAFGMSHKRAAEFQRLGMPVVSVGSLLPNVACVCVNEFESGFFAAHHLIELGHTRIAFLGYLSTQPILLRLSGYQEALLDIQPLTSRVLSEYMGTFTDAIPAWDDRVVRGLSFAKAIPNATMTDVAYFNMDRWLDEGFDQLGCTAIIVQNDSYAFGVMQCLLDRGYRIPADISIVGFDNERECASVSPSLTSVGADMFEVGSRAVDMLTRIINGEQVETSLVPVSVFSRESSGPPPRQPT